jgi:3-hydroxyisobutyrate dehydrogenase-like beta-hydroxyacid dehydrogenase
LVVAAGAATSVQRCKPIFEALGPKLFVVGEHPSMANTVKLSGNFLIATVLESLAEALTFARKSGVEAALLLDFLTTTMFTAPVYKSYSELIVREKHSPPGFTLALGLKDVRLVLQAAEAASVPMPIASVLRDRFLTAMARGNQDKDWSVIGRGRRKMRDCRL